MSSNSTFICFPWFDTAFQGCMTSIILLLTTHTFIFLVLISLSNSSPIFTMSYLNVQLDITWVSQSQYINIEFILLVKNHHPFDNPNFLHPNNSPGLLTQNISFFASLPPTRCLISGPVPLIPLLWYPCPSQAFIFSCLQSDPNWKRQGKGDQLILNAVAPLGFLKQEPQDHVTFV